MNDTPHAAAIVAALRYGLTWQKLGSFKLDRIRSDYWDDLPAEHKAEAIKLAELIRNAPAAPEEKGE